MTNPKPRFINDELEKPCPLQGTLGLRTIFFSSRSHESLRYFRESLTWIIGAGFLGAVIGPTVSFLASSGWNHSLREDFFASSAFFAWMLSEPAFAIMGALNAGLSAQRWRQQARLEEIRLTSLRPIVAGQMMLSYQLRSRLCFIAAAYAGFAVTVIFAHPLHLVSLIIYALIALNAAINFYVFGWIYLALRLDLDTLRAIAALLLVGIVCFLLLIPFIFIIVICMTATFTINSAHDVQAASWHVAITLATLAFWAIKCLLARAYAARLEETVFPRMDY